MFWVDLFLICLWLPRVELFLNSSNFGQQKRGLLLLYNNNGSCNKINRVNTLFAVWIKQKFSAVNHSVNNKVGAGKGTKLSSGRENVIRFQIQFIAIYYFFEIYTKTSEAKLVARLKYVIRIVIAIWTLGQDNYPNRKVIKSGNYPRLTLGTNTIAWLHADTMAGLHGHLARLKCNWMAIWILITSYMPSRTYNKIWKKYVIIGNIKTFHTTPLL